MFNKLITFFENVQLKSKWELPKYGTNIYYCLNLHFKVLAYIKVIRFIVSILVLKFLLKKGLETCLTYIIIFKLLNVGIFVIGLWSVLYSEKCNSSGLLSRSLSLSL